MRPENRGAGAGVGPPVDPSQPRSPVSSLRPIRVLGIAAASLALVGACSGAASPAASNPASQPSATAAASASAEGSGSTGSAQLAVATGAVGSFLTGADGRTLYIYKKDAANATTSACTGQCATKWPPFEVGGSATPTAASGVSGTIATITRSDDGKKQVTYNGAPLYYYASDTKAGDTNGQGVGSVWFVAQP